MNDHNFQKAVELINKSANVLITTHTKVDGDAVGCCIAISEMLSGLNKKSQILFLSSLPDWYSFLVEKPVSVFGKDISMDQLSKNKFELIIIVDTNSNSQLPGFENYLKKTDTPVLVIDHHATSDSLGNVEIADSTAAAACSVVLDLFRFARWPITPKIARALFVGISTDTGWFHFNNTTSRCLCDCAELIDAGANPADIYRFIYQTFSPQRFKLMTAMQNSLELHFDSKYASQVLTQLDFKTTGAKYEDTENLIDQCRRIASLEVAALFVELKDGRVRCSLRSRGAVDVCKIAKKFDGGGHPSAAGTYLPGPIDNAKKLILDAVKSQLQ
jgi:bifunctional oligoribonuclease and PAP phosphatase NrnA